MAKKIEFDYGSILDETVKKFALHTESYDQNRIDQSVSSGMLCTDLMLGNGGWLPGWHTSLGFEQAAKCLRGNTIVNSGEGFVTLAEMIGKQDGFTKVSGKRIRSHKGVRKVSHYFRQEVSKTYKVITEHGYSVTGTGVHPMLTLNPKLKFEWKRLSDIQQGDWIVSSGDTNSMFGSGDLTIDQATVLGNLTANGRYSFFSSFDEEKVDKFIAAFKRAFGVEPRKTYEENVMSGCKFTNTEGYHKEGGYLQTLLHPLGYKGNGAKNKSIPLSVRTASKEALHEFLEAYFECDCGVERNTIKLISASKTLASQLHIILRMGYNIRGSLSKIQASAANSNTPTVRDYYQIFISGGDAATFLQSFKRAKAQAYSDRILAERKHAGGVSNKVIPHVRKAVIETYEDAKLPDSSKYQTSVVDVEGNALHRFKKPSIINQSTSGIGDNHWVSEYLFNNEDWGFFIPHISQIDPSLAKRLKKIVNSGYTYERVVGVSKLKGKRHVYDVTVPKGHAFVANGLVSHNTTTATQTIVEAVKLDIPIIQIWDFERSLDTQYIVNHNNNDGSVTSNTFGKRKADGSWEIKPRAHSFVVDTGEEFFDALHHTLKRLPKKQKIGDKWYLIWKKDAKNKKIVGDNYDQKLYRTMDVYAIQVPDGRPQAVILLDSYPAMNPSLLDEDEGNKRMATAASMFSDNMKRVKSLLGSRKAVLIGINQLRLKPGPSFGNPEYEPGGEALKINSEIRIKHASLQPPQEFRVIGERDGINMIEKNGFGGNDTYKYIKLTTIKNKVGGAPAGTQIWQRVWVADSEGEAHGLDPVFDCWQFLKLTGQADGNIKKFNLSLKWMPKFGNKAGISLVDLKILLYGDKEQKQKLVKKLGGDKNPKILENCWSQLKDGSAYSMFKGVTPEAESDDDEE